MLSRKKTKNEVSKPAEVQGKYVKKETSPLLRSECRGRWRVGTRRSLGWCWKTDSGKCMAVRGVGEKVLRPGHLSAGYVRAPRLRPSQRHSSAHALAHAHTHARVDSFLSPAAGHKLVRQRT